MVTLGQKIRAAREARGLSRIGLAALIGTTYQAITLWENDKRHPQFRYVQRLSEATGEPLDYFKEVHGDTAADTVVHR